MVIKRLSCVFRLSDAGSGRLLTRSESRSVKAEPQ